MKSFVLNIYNRIDHRAFLLSLIFSLFVFFFERTVFKVNYREHTFQFLEFGKLAIFFLIIVILISLFCFFIFTYLSFVSSWKYKLFYFLIFALAVLQEYGYQKAFGRFSSFTDLQIAYFTTSEQKLNAATAYLNLMAAIPCIAYLFVLVTVKPKTIVHGLKSFIAVVVLVFSLTTLWWFTMPKFTLAYDFPTVSLMAFSRSEISFLLFRTFAYKGKREQVEQPQLSANYLPTNNIVFIVDESMRGDHLSLNGYLRPTTSYLEELSKRGLIHNWGIASSASTCSIVTQNLLVTGLGQEDLPDTDEKINKVPLIFQYAKAMRYKTYYLDGQMDTPWGEMEGEARLYVDHRINVSEFYTNSTIYWDTDFEIAKKVNEITRVSSGNFIFVFKRGVHFPYNYQFPPSEKTWEPSFVGTPVDASPEQLQAVINSYDNAIKYNSNRFFQNLASDYSNLPNNTVIIYTGDHGQTLSDNGVNYPHCGESRSEAIVPLFMIGNLGKEVDVKFKASHFNLFATVLDLMNYPEDLRKRKYAISLLKAKESDSKDRYYVNHTYSDGTMVAGSKFKFD